MSFDPRDYLIKVQGGKEYLPVAGRLVWFREDHPDWGIITEVFAYEHADNYAICRATIMNAEGKVMAQATKKEDSRGFGDFLEKAETGAVGRALAMCGYGTQFTDDLDEGDRLADSPHARRQPQAQREVFGEDKEAKDVRPAEVEDYNAVFGEFVSVLKESGHCPPDAPYNKLRDASIRMSNTFFKDRKDKTKMPTPTQLRQMTQELRSRMTEKMDKEASTDAE